MDTSMMQELLIKVKKKTFLKLGLAIILGVICFNVFFTPAPVWIKQSYRMFKDSRIKIQKTRLRPNTSREIKCSRNLKTILLAINYNWPFYSSLKILRKYYGDVFGKVVFCGDKERKGVIKIKENRGFQGYECVATAIRLYPNYTGYIHSNDDVLLNWWTLTGLDTSMIWLGTSFDSFGFQAYNDKSIVKPNWWKEKDPKDTCGPTLQKITTFSRTLEGKKLNLPKYISRYYTNAENRKACVNGRADFFYIPKEYTQVYERVSGIYRDSDIHLEIAVPTFLMLFLNETNHVNLDGMYFPDHYVDTIYEKGHEFTDFYSYQTSFYHPVKLDGIIHMNIFKDIVMGYGKLVRLYCHL